MPREQRRLSDPRDLTALAHPLRMSLLELLVVHGAQTATELAERVGESPANCSWHLRKLAEHGFVEEAPGARGRRRPWQVTSMGYSWEDVGGDPEQAVAAAALTEMLLERELDRLRAAKAALRDDDPAWQQAAETNQSGLWLTADELAEINGAVRDLFVGKLDRHDDPSLRPPGARLCALVQWGVPTYGIADAVPRDGA